MNFFNTLWNINSKYLCICDSKIMCSLIWYDIVLNRYGSSIDFEFACCFLLIVRRKKMFQTLQFTQFILCCISIIHWKKTFIFYVICYGWFSSKYFLAANPYHFGKFGIFFYVCLFCLLFCLYLLCVFIVIQNKLDAIVITVQFSISMSKNGYTFIFFCK